MNQKAKIKLAAHMDAVVAAAPGPSPEKIRELAHLLLPSLTRGAELPSPSNAAKRSAA